MQTTSFPPSHFNSWDIFMIQILSSVHFIPGYKSTKGLKGVNTYATHSMGHFFILFFATSYFYQYNMPNFSNSWGKKKQWDAPLFSILNRKSVSATSSWWEIHFSTFFFSFTRCRLISLMQYLRFFCSPNVMLRFFHNRSSVPLEQIAASLFLSRRQRDCLFLIEAFSRAFSPALCLALQLFSQHLPPVI